ncbi:uncharacterized protein LOC119366260 [Triticum dicoccoides]|uniref:uncharacterized protein LOC119366260 n=1 Tax=Triticum dicoccoides TaxID=85692 RepID=UPI000E7A451F|nr:uncharacterized protein LOC119366260 [Triticum dicoccoides]
MKKLYQGKGRRVHPAPAPAPGQDASAVALAMLPATLLALVAALTAEEQEVLAYLLSGGAGGAAGGAGGGRRRRLNGPHQPEMGCGCFGCYKSFWARWDASPNRHLIHRIIDAVEEGSGGGEGAAKGSAPGGATRRGHRRRRRGRGGPCAVDAAAEEHGAAEAHVGVPDEHLHPQGCCASDGGEDGDYEGDEDDGADSLYGGEEALTDDSDCAGANSSAEKSAVGKLVRFIGEKVWAAWT